MIRILFALALVVSTSPTRAAPAVTLYGSDGVTPLGTTSNPLSIAVPPGSPLPSADPNNAAYSSASATFATGATVAAGRGIYLNCSAAGSVTLSLSGGGSVAYPVAAGASVLPFAVTSVSADTASCTHQNIN